MIDVKYTLRAAYYTLLNGHLTDGINPVQIADTLDTIADTETAYVLLISDGGVSNNTHQSFMTEERIRLDIIVRGSRVATKRMDDIANQILQIILPTPQNSALGNSKFINCRVVDDRYLNFKAEGAINVGRRMITFSQTCAQ